MLYLERGHFVQGSLKQGYSEEEADLVYDMIVKFANYGFPRAHAAAYGVLAFQTAYLKAHYPVHFMASMLTAVMGSHRKVAEYVVECRRMDMEVLPPDVNESGILFTPVFVPSGRAGAGDQSNVSQQNAGADAESNPEARLKNMPRTVMRAPSGKIAFMSMMGIRDKQNMVKHLCRMIPVLDRKRTVADMSGRQPHRCLRHPTIGRNRDW